MHAVVLVVAATLIPAHLALAKATPAPSSPRAQVITLPQPGAVADAAPQADAPATAPLASDLSGQLEPPAPLQIDLDHATATQLQQAIDANRADQRRLDDELIARAAQIEQLNIQLSQLDAQLKATLDRISLEQRQERALARAIYIQPSSAALALAESESIGDFLTRTSDLAAANARAHELAAALQADQRRLSADQARIKAARDQQVTARQTLEGWLAGVQQTQAREKNLLAAIQRKAQQDAQLQAAIAAVAAIPAGSIQDLIREAFTPLGPDAVVWALRVAACESGYDPHAINRYSGASGLFQFMPSTWASPQNPYHTQDVFDARANAFAAAWLYQRSGPNQWSCR